MTYIVALTGGLASGKSTIANLFAKLDVPIIDADIIARHVVEKGTPALTKITQHFGVSILLDDGTLNRQKLREIIFQQDNERYWLNTLLHPLIQQETDQAIAQINAPYILWVVPLLIENNLQNRANRILVIDTEPQIQLERVTQRDNIDKNLAKKMLSSQLLNKERLAHADDIITNDCQRESLITIVEQLHRKYLTLASSPLM